MIMEVVPGFWNVRVKTFPDGRKQYMFSEKVKAEDYEISDEVEHDGSSVERKERENNSRAVQAVYDLAKSNIWHWYCTVTFSGAVVDRYDYAACYEFLKLFCRNLYYTYGCLYLFVPELHEDGAYHFHGLIQGDLPVVEAINPKTGDPLMVKGAQIYNIPIWKAGFSNASRVKSSKAISSYIAKYITKGFSCPKGCHRYLASTRKLLRSTEEKVIMSQEEFGEIFNQARYQKRIAGPYGDFLLCED